MASRGAAPKEAASGLKARPVPLTFTFDTGMLIALERRRPRAQEALRAIVRRGLHPFVPAVVYAEWWRGRTDAREDILSIVRIEPMTAPLCRAAGEALGVVRGATLVDTVVMASAALRGGGIVYTSDPDDLVRLGRHFPSVGILPI